MADTLSHLNAIDLRLSHERARYMAAVEGRRPEREVEWHAHRVRMTERERVAEIEFLAKRGITVDKPEACEMTIEEILAELEA